MLSFPSFPSQAFLCSHLECGVSSLRSSLPIATCRTGTRWLGGLGMRFASPLRAGARIPAEPHPRSLPKLDEDMAPLRDDRPAPGWAVAVPYTCHKAILPAGPSCCMSFAGSASDPRGKTIDWFISSFSTDLSAGVIKGSFFGP